MKLPCRVIPLGTLTPLWTGDADGRPADRVMETGILGSLRCWTELIVRSLGIAVPEHPADDKGSPVSEIFGSTGHRRAFRLQIEDRTEEDPRFTVEDGKVNFTLESVGENPNRRDLADRMEREGRKEV